MKNVKNKKMLESVARELLQMLEADQGMRRRALANDGVVVSEADERLDKVHTERLKEIIAAIGWPVKSKVGPRASTAAWLLAQHADHDVEFQKHCLLLLRALRAGDVVLKHIAYLTDRVNVNQGLPQVYGTQFYTNERGIYGPRPIHNPEHVDTRRRAVGMEPMKEYEARLRRKYGERR